MNPFEPPSADVHEHGARASERFEVTYQLSRLDYLLWNLFHQLRSPITQTLAVATAGFVAYMEAERVPWVAMFVAFYVLFWLVQLGFVCLVVLVGKNRLLLTEYRTSLAAEGFVVQSNFARSTHYWIGIEKVLVGPRVIAVYIDAQGAHLVPKRAFANQAELSQFLSVLQARRRDA